MKRIIDLHNQAANILTRAEEILQEIKIINEDHSDVIENKEDLKEIYLKGYQMLMRSYFRLLRRIQEIGDGTEW